MRIYFIQWNSCYFDCKKYNAEIMSHAVLNAGGDNPRLIQQYGWDNMPDVIAFDADPENLDNIKTGIEVALGTEWIIITEVDWVIKNN